MKNIVLSSKGDHRNILFVMTTILLFLSLGIKTTGAVTTVLVKRNITILTNLALLEEETNILNSSRHCQWRY